MDTNNMDIERSPSPALQPPIPTAPGPRASALQKLYNDAINHILKTCSYTNFAQCFPTTAARVPSSLKPLHEQFTTKLGELLQKEFESIVHVRNVTSSLNELDRLIEDAKRRKARAAEEGHAEGPVAAHTLPAKQLYISHLAPTLKQWDGQMKERQEVLAEENEELIGRVLQQRNDIKALLDGLEDVVKDLNGSVAALNPEEMEELREGNREADDIVVGYTNTTLEGRELLEAFRECHRRSE